MESRPTRATITRLKHQLRRARIACIAAIELGDSHAVARLTCEAARLRDCLHLAKVFGWEAA